MSLISKAKHFYKRVGLFSLGVFVGTVYGAVIATLISYTLLSN